MSRENIERLVLAKTLHAEAAPEGFDPDLFHNETNRRIAIAIQQCDEPIAPDQLISVLGTADRVDQPELGLGLVDLLGITENADGLEGLLKTLVDLGPAEDAEDAEDLL